MSRSSCLPALHRLSPSPQEGSVASKRYCHCMGLVTLLLGFLTSSPGRCPKKTLGPHNWSFISIFSGSLRENLGLMRLETRFFSPTRLFRSSFSSSSRGQETPGLKDEGSELCFASRGAPHRRPSTPSPQSCYVNCSLGIRPRASPAHRVTHAFSCLTQAAVGTQRGTPLGPAGRTP